VTKKTPARPRRDAGGKFAPKKLARASHAAHAAAAGKSTPEIAAELGISRQTAWRVLSSPECQQLVIAAVNGCVARLNLLLANSLDVIDEAMRADRPRVTKGNRDIIEGGPDHYARLTAVSRLLQVFTAGRPKPKTPDQPKDTGGVMTLAELEAQIAADSRGNPTQ
jgi:hypothetical protein